MINSHAVPECQMKRSSGPSQSEESTQMFGSWGHTGGVPDPHWVTSLQMPALLRGLQGGRQSGAVLCTSFYRVPALEVDSTHIRCVVTENPVPPMYWKAS